MTVQVLLYSAAGADGNRIDLDNSFFLMATRMDVLPIEF